MKTKTCCFIGHRKIEVTKDLTERLEKEIKTLSERGVSRFVFGTKSEFSSLCHRVVTGLKAEYPHFVRVVYDTKSESSILEKDREETEKAWSQILKRKVDLEGYEEIVKDEKMYVSGKASYIERDRLMIDASEYCVFYYDKKYKPPVKNLSKRYNMPTSGKSGTSIAYEYALKKKKIVINIFESIRLS